MIIMPVKEGENIEKALKKFKRKYERTGVLKELRRRQYFTRFFHILILIIDKNFLSCLLFFCCFTAGCSLFFLQN